jgi:hypothetical protein
MSETHTLHVSVVAGSASAMSFFGIVFLTNTICFFPGPPAASYQYLADLPYPCHPTALDYHTNVLVPFRNEPHQCDHQ